jgi:hypothetical protein
VVNGVVDIVVDGPLVVVKRGVKMKHETSVMRQSSAVIKKVPFEEDPVTEKIEKIVKSVINGLQE